MKVVLRQDVDNLGARGTVVNVARGYARNYLLPKRLAYEATPGNMKVLEHQRRSWEARAAREKTEAEAFAKRLAAVSLEVTKKAGENETLYGSVTASEIADLLDREGLVVDRRKIVMDEPIKMLGEHSVHVKLHREVVGTVRIQVVGEQAGE